MSGGDNSFGLHFENKAILQKDVGRAKAKEIKASSKHHHTNAPEQKDKFIPKMQITKADPANDGKFSFGQVLKNFMSGLFSPITAIFKHPIQAGLMILGGIMLATLIPASIPIMVAAGIAFGGFQIAYGLLNVTTSLARGKYDDAEKAFENIGAGTSSIGLSLIGARSSAGIAMKAKATTEALKAGKTLAIATEEGLIATNRAKELTRTQAIKECFSMIFTRKGLQATRNDLTLKSIANNGKLVGIRLSNFKSRIKDKINFYKMSDDEIVLECQKHYHSAAKDLNIAAEDMPEFLLSNDIGFFRLGGYMPSKHRIGLNPTMVRIFGREFLCDIISHEMLHARRGINIRANLTNDEIIAIVKNALDNEPVHHSTLMSQVGTKDERLLMLTDNFLIPEGKVAFRGTDKEIATKDLLELIQTMEGNVLGTPETILQSELSILNKYPKIKQMSLDTKGSKIIKLLKLYLSKEGRAYQRECKSITQKYAMHYYTCPEEIAARNYGLNRALQELELEIGSTSTSDLSDIRNLEKLRYLLQRKSALEKEKHFIYLSRVAADSFGVNPQRTPVSPNLPGINNEVYGFFKWGQPYRIMYPILCSPAPVKVHSSAFNQAYTTYLND